VSNLERGIVVPTHNYLFNGSVKVSPEINASDLRRYLLYWDKIDIPKNNLMSTVLSNDCEFLASEGVLQRTHIEYPVEKQKFDATRELRETQFKVLRENQKRKDQRWSMANNGYSIGLPRNDRTKNDSLRLDLSNVLPVPTNDVPLADILGFKDRHEDELQALRIEIDSMYDAFMSSGDVESALDTQKAKLTRAVSDINKAVNSKWYSKIMSSVTIKFDVRNAVIGGSAASLANAPLAIDPVILGAIGALVSSIKVSLTPSSTSSSFPQMNRDYSYLYSLGKEISVE
jgi:hypothetical protein